MEEIFKAAVSQVPALVVLALFVITVLRALVKFIEGRDQFISQLHNEHIKARQDAKESIENNTRAANENTAALSKLQTVIEIKLK